MPVNTQTQNEFIQRLYLEKRLSLDDVYDIFYKSKKSRNSETLESILLSYSGDGESGELLLEKRDDGQPQYSLDEWQLDKPELYNVIYNSCAQSEANKLQSMLNNSYDEKGEDTTFADAASSEMVIIHGDPNAYVKPIRRLEAFTNFVGNLIIQQRFDELSRLIFDQKERKNSAAELAEKYRELQHKYGTFEIFCNPKVNSIYAGEGRGKRHFDEMKIPKGVKREQRVGISGFVLASSLTPNGIPRWEVDVSFDTIEIKSGEFRITHIRWMYTY